MRTFSLKSRSFAVIPFSIGIVFLTCGAITMDQPVSGNIGVNDPQQPSGSVAWGSYHQGDYVRVTWQNYGMNNEYAGSHGVECDEYWNGDFQNGGWSTDDSFSFPHEGMWTVSAFLKDSTHNTLDYAGAGGGVVP